MKEARTIPSHDSNAAGPLDLLRLLDPTGKWNLASIASNGGAPQSAPTNVAYENILAEWIAQQGKRGHGCYYHVARGARKNKLSKSDVTDVRAVWVDCDPEGGKNYEKSRAAILERLQKYRPSPTCIVDSGNGYQALWLLTDAFRVDGNAAQIEIFESVTRRLHQYFQSIGGDSCWSIDHLLRLPGSINFLTQKKLDKGYPPGKRIASIVHWVPQNIYDFSTFPQAAPLAAPPNVEPRTAATNPNRITDLFEHKETKNLKPWVIRTLMDGKDLQGEKTWKSRSEAVFACCCEMVRSGVSDETMYSIITDPDYGISESLLQKHVTLERDATRVISRAREAAVDENLFEMNSKHAVIGDLKGKCRILNETVDPITGEATVSFSSFEDIANRYGNRLVKETNTKGEEKFAPLAAWWFRQRSRRYYESVAFAPGGCGDETYNLWRGFTVEPLAGDCSLYLAHIRDNICRGDETLYRYVINWMAQAVQFPGEIGRVALVLRGRMGIGKGEFVQHFGRLFGPSFIPVTKPEHIIGKFNGHMGQCIILFADEAFYAGNKEHEAILKTLVTEKSWMIEYKGFDAKRSPSCLHNILASNSDWVVPTDADDRRYCVIDCGDNHIRDSAYFIAIQRQMKSGGYEALLHLLLNTDPTEFNPEQFPRTDEHARQRALSLRGVDSLVATLCHEGSLPSRYSSERPNIALTTGEEDGRGFYHYVKATVPDLKLKTGLFIGNALRAKPWNCKPWRSKSARGLEFPPLAELREAFVVKHGPQAWQHPHVEEWSQGGTDDAL